jgi:hypothetical protein
MIEQQLNAQLTREQNFILMGDLSEAKYDAENRVAELTVIRKGWSKNGFYYGDRPLQAIAEHINGSARKVYLNHNKRSEIFEPRLVEDHVAENLGATVAADGLTVVTKAKFFKSGPKAWVFDRMRESPESLGPSIVGKAKIRQGTAEGRKGPIVEDITYLHSYDLVSGPSAGGKVNSVAEGMAPVENGTHFEHIFEGVVSDEDQQFLLEALGAQAVAEADTPQVTILKDRIKQKQARRDVVEKWYDLQYTFTDELGNIVLAREGYEFAAVADRKKLVTPLIEEFTTEINKMNFIAPRPIPKGQGAVAGVSSSEQEIKITFDLGGALVESERRVPIEPGVIAVIGRVKDGEGHTARLCAYCFEASKWDEAGARTWTKKTIEQADDTEQEGEEEMSFKNLSEMKEAAPALYASIIAEARSAVQNDEQTNKWKTDSEKLPVVQESLAQVTAAHDKLTADHAAMEAENKTLKEENARHALAEQVARKREIIADVKKTVGLAEDMCSSTFNTVLEGVAFDPAKENEFTGAITALVEDRKEAVGHAAPTLQPKISGVGPTAVKPRTVVESAKPMTGKELAAALQG